MPLPHESDQLDTSPTVDRRRERPSDESPSITLASVPAVRVLTQLPVPILGVTRDGTVVFANEAFATMLGYDERDVSLLSLRDVFDAATQAECAVSLIREHAEELVDLSHADGGVIRAVMSRSVLERHDDEVALVAFHDLTEKLWAEGR